MALKLVGRSPAWAKFDLTNVLEKFEEEARNILIEASIEDETILLFLLHFKLTTVARLACAFGSEQAVRDKVVARLVAGVKLPAESPANYTDSEMLPKFSQEEATTLGVDTIILFEKVSEKYKICQRRASNQTCCEDKGTG